MVGVRAWLRLGLLPLGVALLLVLSTAFPARAATGFARTAGDLTSDRSDHTATLLPSGKVLIVGGKHQPGQVILQSAELYDPATGRFTLTSGQPASPRRGHGAARLPNGDVLIAGGAADSTATALLPIEVYHADTDTFTTVATNQPARLNASVTALADGRVLIAGGFSAGTFLATAQIYDPADGSLTATANNLGQGRSKHVAVLLTDGRVLLAGGTSRSGSIVYLTSAEVFDPATNSFAPAGDNLAIARANVAATLLPDGDVLFAGGEGDGALDLASAELYETANARFVQLDDMTATRSAATATVLQDGRVLIAGGRTDGSTTKTALLYRPTQRLFVSLPGTSSLSIARMGHTATRLLDGTVLLAAGEDGITLSSAELYTPDFIAAVTIQPASAAVVSSATNNNVVVNVTASGSAGTEDTVTVTVTDAAGAAQVAAATVTIQAGGTGASSALFEVATLGTAHIAATDTSGTAITGRDVLIQPAGFSVASPPAAARSGVDVPLTLTALADGAGDATHYQGTPQLASPASLGAAQDLAFGGSCPAFTSATATCTANFGDLGPRQFVVVDGSMTTASAVAVVPNGFVLSARDAADNPVDFARYRSGARFTLTAVATVKAGARVAGYDGADFSVALTSNDPSAIACAVAPVAPVAGTATFASACFVALGGQPGSPLAPTLTVRDGRLADSAASQALVVGPATLNAWPTSDTTRSGDQRTLTVFADAYGGAVADRAAYRGALTVAVSADAAATVPAAVAFTDQSPGVASVPVTLYSLGAQTVTLTERDDGVAASATITVAPRALTIQAGPAEMRAGDTATYTVAPVAEGGGSIAGYAANVTLTADGAGASIITAVPQACAPTCAFQVSFPQAGSAKISGTDNGLFTAGLSEFDVTVYPPSALRVDPDALAFTATAGTSPPSQTLHLRVDGALPLQWTAVATADTGGAWLTIGPDHGTTPAGATVDATVAVGAAGLAPGDYTGRIAVSAPDAATPQVTIAVTLTIVPTYALTLAAAPAGAGTVTANPAAGPYPAGTTVTITAWPASGQDFAGWTLDGAAAGAANPFPVTMDRDHALVARFAPAPPSPGPSPSPAPPGTPPPAAAWSAWASQGGVLTDAPAAAGFHGRVYVFARGTDSALYVTSSADGDHFDG
ncbi:MAG TPA: kelch repeat-containing protein, partial [Thermomicrobiales bacterium]|nr:kelch repeat-containing protein [Thermomicrobiales bacterium]